MDISSAKHVRQVALLSGEVMTTESYHYHERSGGLLRAGENDVELPYPDIPVILRNARHTNRFPLKYWRSREGAQMLGIGSAVQVVPFAGFGSLRDVLERGYRETLGHFYHMHDIPGVFFSMYFDPLTTPHNRWNQFPAIHFHVPAIVLKIKDDKQTVYFTGTRMAVPELRAVWVDLTTKTPPPGQTGDNAMESAWDDAGYSALVEAALGQIRNGGLSKAVLARECAVEAARPFDTVSMLERFESHFPECYHYYSAPTQSATFVSVTPERLAAVDGGVIRASALAGTLPYSEDNIGALVRDRKNLSEHAFVVDSIRRQLGEICGKVAADDKPSELRLENVIHLHTSIQGTLKNGCGLIDSIAALHPTPAVCGTPTAEALDFIRAREGGFRGLYAGLTGWIDSHNQGEVAVAIRSAIIESNKATLFTGAGIVEGSHPEDEIEETKAKANAILDILREG